MGRKRKKTNIIDATEIKKVSKTFARGEGPDLKSIQDKKLKRELIVKEKLNAQAIRSAAFNQLLLPEVFRPVAFLGVWFHIAKGLTKIYFKWEY